MNKKFLIIGWGRHGKDTMCEFMKEQSSLNFQSSSEFCAERVVYPTMADMYSSWQDCYEDRGNHRKHWYETIKAYNEPDGSRLATEMLTEYDIYCGMRNIEELNASHHLFDLVVWVEDPRKPPESLDSMTITKDQADIVIYNDSTLDDFKDKVRKLMSIMG